MEVDAGRGIIWSIPGRSEESYTSRRLVWLSRGSGMPGLFWCQLVRVLRSCRTPLLLEPSFTMGGRFTQGNGLGIAIASVAETWDLEAEYFVGRKKEAPSPDVAHIPWECLHETLGQSNNLMSDRWYWKFV